MDCLLKLGEVVRKANRLLSGIKNLSGEFFLNNMHFLINLLINGFAVFVSAYLLEGVHVDNFLTAIVVSIVLGIVNTVVKPIVSLLTLPLNILTLGLFNFILNGLMILLVSAVVPGFSVANIWWAILFSLVLSLVNWFLHLLKK